MKRKDINRNKMDGTPSSTSVTQEENWLTLLTLEELRLLQRKVEKPFSGMYWNHDKEGCYTCSQCEEILFNSSSKFDAGTGFASFKKPHSSHAITYHIDFAHDFPKKEIRCASCQNTLGHLFDDGPEPSCKRYSIQSSSLGFSEQKAASSKDD